jgi:hypothetical protein
MSKISWKLPAFSLLAGIPLGVGGHVGSSLIEFNYHAVPAAVEVVNLLELDDTNEFVTVRECTPSLFNNCYAVVAIGDTEAELIKVGGRTTISNPSETLYIGQQYDGLYYEAERAFSQMGSMKLRPGVCRPSGPAPKEFLI